jgi:Tfp pilus tip-associated adhesin PilY1
VHTIDTNTTGGLSSPVLVNTDETDLTVETAFAGDINGDLWMFRLNKTDPENSTFRKVFDGALNRRSATHRRSSSTRIRQSVAISSTSERAASSARMMP